MADLTDAQRKRMKKSSFALPAEKTKANPTGEGGYPIPDLAHARNALARAAQNASPAQQAQIKRAVYAKYPSLNPKGKGK